ncbi:MAG: pyruvate kinase [Bacteroidia bacterium]
MITAINQSKDERQKVKEQLRSILSKMLLKEEVLNHRIGLVHKEHQISAVNFIHYLVLRSQNIREMQDHLHKMGLSSLDNSEGQILNQIVQILKWMNCPTVNELKTPCDYEQSSKIHKRHLINLLGKNHFKDQPNIMVTLSEKHLYEPEVFENMLLAGMTIARINCAHDNEEIWEMFISKINEAKEKTNRECKVYIDLAGPKIRVKKLLDKMNNEQPLLEMQLGDKALLCSKPQKNYNQYQIVMAPKKVLAMVKKGESVFFDDGKFEAVIKERTNAGLLLKFISAPIKKNKLKVEKGINFPESDLKLKPLTRADEANLPFVVEHADLIGFSFVSKAQDIDHLRSKLAAINPKKAPALILKIELLNAVENLPELLLNGMKDAAFGVMIARGDLAVEIGFERLSEIQKEIIWLCRASHTPVVWATQVLESLNKTGLASRSEITDAANSVAADCVMLNKGDYIIETIETLSNILKRQQGHRHRRRYVMRPLRIAQKFVG